MWRWILATAFIFSFNMGVSLTTIPFAVSLAGFWPAAVSVVLAWIYLLITGLYYLEATLACPPRSNIFTFSLRYTGSIGSWIASMLLLVVNFGYLIYFYYLLDPIVVEMLHHYLNKETILLLVTLIFGASIALGFRFTIVFNFALTLMTLVILYFVFTAGYQASSYEYIKQIKWGFLLIIFPTLVNSLYFNTLIPSIAPFLEYNRKKLQGAIITALTLSGMIFIAWLYITIASAHDSDNSLSKLNPLDINLTNLQRVPIFGNWLPIILILNMATSTLGLATILIDFFFDLLRNKIGPPNIFKRAMLSLLIFIVPLILNIYPSKLLYVATNIITDVGPLYLAGLFPILCAWSLRYFYKDNAPHLVPGGKPMMLTLGVFSCFIFYLVGLQLFYEGTFG